jgi:hypothetical protein
MSDANNSMMMGNDAKLFQRRLLEHTERLLHADIACTTALGLPIQVGLVISRSSSSSSSSYMINGQQKLQQQQQCHWQVSVRGSRCGGVIRIVATDGNDIQAMILSVVEDGKYPPREINVRLSSFDDGGLGTPDGRRSTSPSEIVDAEIVDKDNQEHRTKPIPSEYWSATI